MVNMVPKLFFIDIEVDSVPRERGEPLQSITQIAVCDPSRPEDKRYFVANVLPNKLLRRNDTGFNTQAVEGPRQFKFKHVWKDLTQWVNGSLDGNRQALFVGHNIYKHDWPILTNECLRVNQTVPKFWKTFDTLYLAGTLYGKGGNTQVELCHRLGVPVIDAHNALNDVKMCEGIFRAMIGQAKVEKVLKAAMTAPEDHPVVAVANVIRKFVEPILVFYDFETTGLFADKKNPSRPNPRAVELGAFIPSVNKGWGTLINPGIPIPEEAIGIHGITNEMVQGKPTFKAAWLSFEDWINTEIGATANKVVVLVGHNVWGYDDKVYKAECERTNLPVKTWKTFDTLALARVMCSGGKKISHKLQDWRERLNVEVNQAHRAVGDVVVNAQVWAKWVEGVPAKELNKAIMSGHPVKAVSLLIHERGTFKPSDYTKDPKAKIEDQGTNSYVPVKQEEHTKAPAFVAVKQEPSAVKIIDMKEAKVKVKKLETNSVGKREREEEEKIQQPLESAVKQLKAAPVANLEAPVFVNAVVPAPQPMDIGQEEDEQSEELELVFNARYEIKK